MNQHRVYSARRINGIVLMTISEMIEGADNFADVARMKQLKLVRAVKPPPNANTSHGCGHCQKRSPMPCRRRENVKTLASDDG